jgi:glycosyltransferase involved in cell wall biosynthesis
MRRMHTIALDYTPAYEQGGGIGRYVRELTAALARQAPEDMQFRLFVAGARRNPLPPLPGPQFTWKPTPVPPEWWARVWHRAHLPLPIEAIVGPVSLLHATDFVLPPTLPGTRTLLTVHDLSYVRVPQAASPRLKAYLDRVVPRSVARADHVLADSAATRDDLMALYGTPADKITVLYSGVDPAFQRIEDAAVLQRVRAHYHLPAEPFVLSVGTVQPRKNYPALVEAVAALRARGHALSVVIAGGRGWMEDPIYAAIDALNMRDHVHFIGFARDEDLPALYSMASCFALPSLYEGFGLPVLEAMACGTPVITSNLSSLPEVAGDAAILIPPQDIRALANALETVLTNDDRRRSMQQAGVRQAAQFSWDSSARQLAAIYRRLLGESP